MRKDCGQWKIYEVLEILAALHLYFSKVFAARKKNLTTACARKTKQMLAKTIRYS